MKRDKNWRKLDRKFQLDNNTTGTNLNRWVALPGNFNLRNDSRIDPTACSNWTETPHLPPPPRQIIIQRGWGGRREKCSGCKTFRVWFFPKMQIIDLHSLRQSLPTEPLFPPRGLRHFQGADPFRYPSQTQSFIRTCLTGSHGKTVGLPDPSNSEATNLPL